jgi:hypothetical protein
MIFVASLLAQPTFAAVLELKPGANVREGVNISEGATATVKGEKSEIVTVGSALRTKKVLIANIKVYVAQFMVSNPARYSKTDALNSLEDQEVAVMRLSFLRFVDAEKVRVSFEDALVANGVSLKDPEMSALLNAIVDGGAAEQGGSLLFLVKKNSDGSETMIYETTGGKISVIEGTRGLTKKLFSMWLGVSADDGIVKFQRELLK